MLRLLLMLCLFLVSIVGNATGVYVFGDSLSATTTPNTISWVTYISSPYQLIANYATMGAGTGQSSDVLYTGGVTSNNLITQVSSYTAYSQSQIVNGSTPINSSCAGDKIHVIWIGTNDSIVYNNLGYTSGYSVTQLGPLSYASGKSSYDYLTSAISTLKSCGATRIYVVGLYDFSYSRLGRSCSPLEANCTSPPNSTLQAYIATTNSQIQNISAQNGVTYVDTYYDSGWASNYQLNINSMTADTAIFDGIHLATDRQRIIYRRICHVVTGADCT